MQFVVKLLVLPTAGHVVQSINPRQCFSLSPAMHYAACMLLPVVGGGIEVRQEDLVYWQIVQDRMAVFFIINVAWARRD